MCQWEASLAKYRDELVSAVEPMSTIHYDQEYRVGYKSEFTGLHFELQVNARVATVRNGIRDFVMSPSTKKFLVCTSKPIRLLSSHITHNPSSEPNPHQLV